MWLGKLGAYLYFKSIRKKSINPQTVREHVNRILPYFFGYKTEFFPSKTIPKI